MTLPWITLGLSILLLLLVLVGFIVWQLHRIAHEMSSVLDTASEKLPRVLPPNADSRAESRWIDDRVKRGEGFEE